MDQYVADNGLGLTHIDCSVCKSHYMAVTVGMDDDKIIEKLLNLGWVFGKDDAICKECVDRMKEGVKNGY